MSEIAILTARGEVSAIKNRGLRNLFAYWDGQRGDRPMPSRRDIDPLNIEPAVLPYVLLTEVRQGGQRFYYRLAGTALSNIAGMQMSGRYLDELISGRYLEYVESLYRELVTRRRPLYSESTYLSELGQPDRITERLMMPLSEDGETVSMVLSGQLFRTPVPMHEARPVFQDGQFREEKRFLL